MSSFFGISMDASDFSGYAANLTALSGGMDDNKMWGSTLGDIGDYFVEQIKEEFETQGAKSGGWEALNQDYAGWKEDHYGSLPILFLTSDYEGSFGWDDLGGDAIIIRSSLESTKQKWHTFGRDNMPFRPPFVVNGKDLDAVDRIFSGGFDTLIFNRL